MFKKKYLADYAIDRSNNFNLIRFIAASLVLYSHSLSLTGSVMDPLMASTGISFGNFAVHVFFITSGFLVTASLLNRANMKVFVKARILRIVPGLFVANLFTVLVIGTLFTILPLYEYLGKKDLYRYMVTNTVLLYDDLRWGLPGVFLSNPYPKAVNGSLWTLPYEVQMYGILVLIGLLTYTGVKLLNARSIRWLVGLGAIALVGYNIYHYIDTQKMIYWPVLGGMFFTGAFAYLLKDRIVMSSLIAIPMAVSLYYYAAGWPPGTTYFVLYWLFLTYLTLYLSYVPRGPLLHYNKLGDYSYGMYIYAFPIQQALASSFPDISADQMTFAAFPLTLIAAVLSWHLVEKKALALKNIPLLSALPRWWKKNRFEERQTDKG